MSIRYFHASNCSKKIVGKSGKAYTFAAYQLFGGSWRGVYEATPEEAADMEPLTFDKKSGVTEIDKVTFEADLKKKDPNWTPLTASAAKPQARAQAPVAVVADRPGVLVEGAKKEDPVMPVGAVPESIESVLKVGTVKMTQPPDPGLKQARRVRQAKVVKAKADEKKDQPPPPEDPPPAVPAADPGPDRTPPESPAAEKTTPEPTWGE